MEEIVSNILTILAVVMTAVFQRRDTAKNAAKQSILQMIMEDHICAAEGKFPANYQNILHEYDIYHKNGGNSYITEKVEEYKKWYAAKEKVK